MLQFSQVKSKMDTIRAKVSKKSINKKQACAELRKYMLICQKKDIDDAIELFKAGWLC